MQEKSVCCRNVPYLAHMEQGPGPLNPEDLPPSLSAWVLGTQPTTIGAKKIDAYKKKVGRKQNIITFFLLEIGQKFKHV